MDDEFDDDLDGIPDNTLQELEQRAFSSTQKQAVPVKQAPRPPGIRTYGSNGLSRNHTNNNAWKPPQPRRSTPQQPAVQHAPPASAPEPPSSDYGFDDEDVIDLDERSMTLPPDVQRSVTLPPGSGLPTRSRPTTPAVAGGRDGRHGSKAPMSPGTAAAFAAADAELGGAPQPGRWDSAPHLAPKPAAPQDSGQLTALQARVAALEAESARLKQSEKAARDAALAKQGEIAIVRSNQDKAVKEYERRMAVMQKLHSDETTKWKGELEAGKKEREKMDTDNRFLQHDLAEQVERGKRLNGPGKARTAVNGLGTPKKSKKSTNGLGDGFDDDEVRLVSPSRSKEKEKSREQTPRAGTKRKRPANDSPVAPLSFSQPAASTNGDHGPQPNASFHAPQTPAATVKDTRFDFMHRLLAFTSEFDDKRAMETLAGYHFPSDERRSISSLLLDGLSTPHVTNQDSQSFPLKTAGVLLDLWSRALVEKYYKPVNILMELVRFILALQPASKTSQLIEAAVPVCVRSIELVATTAFRAHRASMNPKAARNVELEAQTAAFADLDADEMLDFLLELAQAASLSASRIEVFWQHVDLNFILLMLNKAHPISQITTILRVLATSALQTTSGPICVDPDDTTQKQSKWEREMVDRLTILLFDVPKAPADEPPYTALELTDLRLEVSAVLKNICATDHGCALLASHRSFIGRLVRFLDRQVNSLYDTPPTLDFSLLSLNPQLTPSSGPPDQVHDLITKTISASVTLLYHILRTHDNESPTTTSTIPNFNLLTKLQAVKGGYHKFLVALTRIAFSEQLVLEHGIGDEIVEGAHEILDNVLSPEEGEAVIRAVETPRGTRGTSHTGETTERDTSEEGVGEDVEGGGMEEEPG